MLSLAERLAHRRQQSLAKTVELAEVREQLDALLDLWTYHMHQAYPGWQPGWTVIDKSLWRKLRQDYGGKMVVQMIERAFADPRTYFLTPCGQNLTFRTFYDHREAIQQGVLARQKAEEQKAKSEEGVEQSTTLEIAPGFLARLPARFRELTLRGLKKENR